MSEEVFTGDWVQKNLPLKQDDKLPKLDRCDQIAAEFKRAYALANPIPVTILWDSPHIHWMRPQPPDREPHQRTATIHDEDPSRRWPEYVLAMGEVIQAALNAANEDRIREGRIRPFGFSKDGPVVRFLVKVLPLITGEQPSTANVSQELYRQLRRRPR